MINIFKNKKTNKQRSDRGKNLLSLFIISLIVSLLLLSCQTVYYQNPSGDLQTDIQDLLDYYQLKNRRVGMGILYSHPRMGIYTAFSGTVTTESNTPVDSSTLFEIGSASKMFIAIVIMQLIQEGKLRLETPLDSFFPEIHRSDSMTSITIKDLLQHTEGIPDYISNPVLLSSDKNFLKEWSSQELIETGLNAPPVNSSQWNYSNTGYIFLGEIIRIITGRPAEIEIRNRILKPLGMESTYFLPTEKPDGFIAHGYYVDIAGRYWDSSTGVNPTLFSYAGAYVSTPTDMQIFLTAYREGLLVSPATREEMENFIPTPNPWVYGLGILRLNSYNGKYIGHGGSTFGTKSICLIAPDTGEVIILYSIPVNNKDFYTILENLIKLTEYY